MFRDRFKTGLAVVGGCAALSIVLPPLAGALNAVGSLALLALAGYAAYRTWAWMEKLVEASHRPATVRRNLGSGGPEQQSEPVPSKAPARSRARNADPRPPEHGLRWPRIVRWDRDGELPRQGR